MSVEALLWATKQIIPAQPKLVLLMLADWYNELESCAWPTHDQLAEKCGMSRRSVQRHLEWLVERGLVEKEQRIIKGRQVSNRYRLPVNVLVFQGCQIDAPRGVRLTQPGGQIDAPSNTLKDTVKDTENSPGAKMTSIKDVLDGQDKYDREEIRERAKRDSAGNFTPAALGWIWKHARAGAAPDNGFQVELTKSDLGYLKNAYAKLGKNYIDVVWGVMSDWVGFIQHAEKYSNAFNSPMHPNISFFVKYAESAADFVAVQSTAKPLTKQTTKKDNGGKKTLEEMWEGL